MRALRVVTLLVLVGVLLAGCGLFSGSEELPPTNGGDEPGEPTGYIFFDDFSEDETGAAPGKWEIKGADESYSSFEVVDNQPTESGKAVRVWVGHPNESFRTDMNGLWSEQDEETTQIAIEYKFKLNGGKGIFNIGNPPRIQWWAESGKFVYNQGSTSGGQVSVPIGTDWHTVKIIANRKTSKALVFLDNMDTPVIGPVDFLSGRTVDSWSGMYFEIQHWTHVESDIVYADFKVWSID